MKKLLGLLGSIALVASTSGVAVACGSNDSRISTPTLNEDVAKQIIASLSGVDGFDFQESDLFSDVDLTTSVVNIINNLVSINYNYERTNSNLTTLGLNTFDKSKDADKAGFEAKFNNLIKSIAENKLFSEFSKSIAKDSFKSIDYTMGNDFYGYNPIEEVTEVTGVDGQTYYVKAESQIKFGADKKVWRIQGDTGSDDGIVDQIPTVSDLTAEYTSGSTGSVFYVDASASKDDLDATSEINISAKTALTLRFQDYFQNKIMQDVMTNALTMVYNESSLFRNLKKDDTTNPYIDITNPVFSKTQSWSSDGDFTTNVKMVWVYTIKGTKDDSDATVSRTIKEKLGSIIDSTGKLSDPKKTGIGNIFKALNDGGFTNANDQDGSDPYFGNSGYKGIVVHDTDTIGDNPISGAAYESAVNTADNLKNGGGIIMNGTDKFVYQNSDNSNNYDVVIALPIYMMQLMGVDKIVADNNGGSMTAKAKDVNVYKVTGNGYDANDGEATATGKTFREAQFQRAPETDSKSSFWNSWKQNGIASYDIDNMLASDNGEEKQNSMFQEIEYLISQDSTNQDTAKRVIYSKYLDADMIYYAGLYDQIGTYITTSSSEDE